MSLPIDSILAILRDGNHLTGNALQAVAKDLIAAEKEEKANKEPAVKTKTRLVGLVRQDVGSATLGGVYILSVPDDDSTDTYSGVGLLNRLRAAAVEHNDAPRGRKGRTKVTTWDQLLRNVKAKTFKASGSQIGVKAKGNAHELVVLPTETIAPQ